MLQIPKDTLRYYDRIGLVSPSRRENRYRRYSKTDVVDLMNIQMMQVAGFTLEEMKGKFNFRRMEDIDPTYCGEAASFLDAKQAEIRRKIEHLEQISQLLGKAAETLRNFNPESDRRLAEMVREIYRSMRGHDPVMGEEGCNAHQD